MKFQSSEDYDYEVKNKQKIKQPTISYEVNMNSLRPEATDLMSSKCDYKNIFGYKSVNPKDNSDCIVKYNKNSEVFVAYKDNSIISCFYRTYRNYNSMMYDDTTMYHYVDEL